MNIIMGGDIKSEVSNMILDYISLHDLTVVEFAKRVKLHRVYIYKLTRKKHDIKFDRFISLVTFMYPDQDINIILKAKK